VNEAANIFSWAECTNENKVGPSIGKLVALIGSFYFG
jgi:hypothetical protein